MKFLLIMHNNPAVWESLTEDERNAVMTGHGGFIKTIQESGEMIVTQIFEDQLSATQRVHFDPDSDGSLVTVEFEYELQKGGPLRGLTDVLFIRRALSDMLARTLRRFSTEAAEEANL